MSRFSSGPVRHFIFMLMLDYSTPDPACEGVPSRRGLVRWAVDSRFIPTAQYTAMLQRREDIRIVQVEANKFAVSSLIVFVVCGLLFCLCFIIFTILCLPLVFIPSVLSSLFLCSPPLFSVPFSFSPFSFSNNPLFPFHFFPVIIFLCCQRKSPFHGRCSKSLLFLLLCVCIMKLCHSLARLSVIYNDLDRAIFTKVVYKTGPFRRKSLHLHFSFCSKLSNQHDILYSVYFL